MKLTPKLALIGLVVAAVAVIASALVPLLGEDDHQNADGRVMALKEGLHSIEVGVRHWAAAHDSDCPPASRVSGEGLGMLRGDQTIPAWPANPYTGQPMAQGWAPGDFGYERGADGRTFRLTAFSENGKSLLTISQ